MHKYQLATYRQGKKGTCCDRQFFQDTITTTDVANYMHIFTEASNANCNTRCPNQLFVRRQLTVKWPYSLTYLVRRLPRRQNLPLIHVPPMDANVECCYICYNILLLLLSSWPVPMNADCCYLATRDGRQTKTNRIAAAIPSCRRCTTSLAPVRIFAGVSLAFCSSDSSPPV